MMYQKTRHMRKQAHGRYHLPANDSGQDMIAQQTKPAFSSTNRPASIRTTDTGQTSFTHHTVPTSMMVQCMPRTFLGRDEYNGRDACRWDAHELDDTSPLYDLGSSPPRPSIMKAAGVSSDALGCVIQPELSTRRGYFRISWLHSTLVVGDSAYGETTKYPMFCAPYYIRNTTDHT